MLIHKTIHTRNNVDRIYGKNKEGERKLASINDCTDSAIKWLEHYTRKVDIRQITESTPSKKKTKKNCTTKNRRINRNTVNVKTKK